MSQTNTVVIDGEGQILGRLASNVVRYLKEGKKVEIVNVEKVILSGPMNRVLASYTLMFDVKTLFNPYTNSVIRPRSPERIFKRTIRGMLPKGLRGIRMLKMVKAYTGIPEHLKDKEKVKPSTSDGARLKGKFVTLYEVSKSLGWNE
ncbi:50S ribosomal protein L13 [Sulfuracidifex metallicus]|uniref:50S ribosomal protein L13 n=1 Tax=Sulfuracidifex metallicus TaxID=47303 RepID=UPI00227469FF|nr:50S ribosomal protein L13 [Sulfuracidifex metallicus]MCY0850853.1 50S ribosomal protein L13 [Sulfuracidifex metallicus]